MIPPGRMRSVVVPTTLEDAARHRARVALDLDPRARDDRAAPKRGRAPAPPPRGVGGLRVAVGHRFPRQRRTHRQARGVGQGGRCFFTRGVVSAFIAAAAAAAAGPPEVRPWAVVRALADAPEVEDLARRDAERNDAERVGRDRGGPGVVRESQRGTSFRGPFRGAGEAANGGGVGFIRAFLRRARNSRGRRVVADARRRGAPRRSPRRRVGGGRVIRARRGLRVRLRARRRGRRRRGTRRVVARHVDAQLRELRGEVAGHGLDARVGREVGDDLRERAPDLRDRRGGRRVALRVAIHRRGLLGRRGPRTSRRLGALLAMPQEHRLAKVIFLVLIVRVAPRRRRGVVHRAGGPRVTRAPPRPRANAPGRGHERRRRGGVASAEAQPKARRFG